MKFNHVVEDAEQASRQEELYFADCGRDMHPYSKHLDSTQIDVVCVQDKRKRGDESRFAYFPPVIYIKSDLNFVPSSHNYALLCTNHRNDS